MTKIFKYKLFDKRNRIITIALLLIVGGIIYLIWRYMGEGGYLTAWIISLLAAIIALFVLSVPRHVRVMETAVEIACVVEMTRILFDDIQSVRRLEQADMKKMFPIFGSFGFFGNYGYYIDFKTWQTVKLYCGEWKNFVEITDIYEKRVIVNCTDPDGLVESLLTACGKYNG